MFLFRILEQQKLDLNTYTTTKKQLKYKSYRDLLDYQVECPNDGLMKNFVLRKDSSNYIWFEYQCYSYKKSDIVVGEPIFNDYVYFHRRKIGKTPSNNIKDLNNESIDCLVDWGLKSFRLYLNSGYVSHEGKCLGLKITTATGISIKSNIVKASVNTLDGLIGVFVGSTAKETDTNIGYPLRGFKIVVETINDSLSNASVYILYSYSKLRNMEKAQKSYQDQMANFRNKNNQLD